MDGGGSGGSKFVGDERCGRVPVSRPRDRGADVDARKMTRANIDGILVPNGRRRSRWFSRLLLSEQLLASFEITPVADEPGFRGWCV